MYEYICPLLMADWIYVRILLPGDKRVIAIIKKKINCDKQYRPSVLAYTFSEGRAHLLRSSLTDMAVSLSDLEWTFIVSTGVQPVSGTELMNAGLEELVRSGFFVEKGVPFRSKLITNATFMTPELLEEAVTLWHLDTVQVSVDGERKDYEARKQYVNPTAYHYEAMMEAVGRMLEKGIRVTLRCNYDGENLDGLKHFIDDVKDQFGCPENLSIYPAMLFQAKAEESNVKESRGQPKSGTLK